MWPVETIRIVAQLPQGGIFLSGPPGSKPQAGGLSWARFEPSYTQAHPAKERYDFSLIDQTLEECDQLGLTLIVGLLPTDQRAERQDRYWPIEFAKYAAAFAQRYPQIHYYTLANGLPLADSSLDERASVQTAANLAKAAILGRRAIEQVWLAENRAGEPLFFETAGLGLAMAAPGSGREAEAVQFNLRRFASLDLMLGHADPKMSAYLQAQGLSSAEYQWFIDRGRTDRTILSLELHPASVHTLEADRIIHPDPLPSPRLIQLIEEYWARYPLPLLYAELSDWSEPDLDRCQSTYDSLCRLRSLGYPVVGMGWYSSERQVGEPTALFAELAGQGLPAFDHREVRYRMRPALDS